MRGWMGFLASAALAAPLHADVVELVDGRRFEGKILSQSATHVRFDTQLSPRTRFTLSLAPAEIKSIKEAPLSPGFFDPPPAESRASDPKKFKSDQTLYLEVPIIGALGKRVFADGLAPVLSYGRAHGIRHIVYYIDSPGGDFDEAAKIYRLLKESKRDVKYHAIIRQCQGEALAIAVWCDTVHLLPGSVVGGVADRAADSPSAQDKEDGEVVWSHIAYKVVTDTGRSGRPAQVVRALLDPSEELAAWRGKDGTVETGPTPPDDLPAGQLIFKDGPGEALKLSQEQAIALGMPAFQGEVKDLGAVLKLRDWTVESDYGSRTMNKVADQKEKKAKSAQAAYEAKVERNVSKRQEIEQSIQDAIKEAAGWDPTKTSYETYAEQWNWGWGWSGGTNSGKWTVESQKKWKTRTDATRHYLTIAGKGLASMKRLDEEALKLNIDPTYQPGEIDRLLKDLTVKLAVLQQHRGKTGE